jgi:hypothetical protein
MKMIAVTKIEKEMIESLRRAAPGALDTAVLVANYLQARYPSEKKPALSTRAPSPLRLVRTA